MNLFIDDGYTTTKTIDAVPGIHPEFTVIYRPALHEEQRRYRAAADKGPDQLAKYELEAIRKHVREIDGVPIAKIHNLASMRRNAIEKILNLVFGYEPEDEGEDAKNS